MTARKRTMMCGLMITAGGLIAGNAQAGVVYSYVATAPSSTTPTNAISIPVGGTPQTIAVYVQETGGSFIGGDGGLFSGGFSMALNGTPANPATLTSATGFAANFTGGNSAEAGAGDSNALRRIDNTVSNAVSVAGTGGPTPVNGLIEIGTVTIAPATVAGTSQFTIWDYEQTAQANKIVGGYTQTNGSLDLNLDLSITSGANQYSGTGANPTTFTVTTTAVPEPGSLAVLALGGFGLLARRRRGL